MSRVWAAVLALGLGAAACGGAQPTIEADMSTGTDAASTDAESDAPTTNVAPSTTAPVVIEEGPKAPFTGLAVEERVLDTPALVVKISNNDDRSLEALIGIDDADVVIEERIEDRATRFAAIFHSQVPDVVGPIRSARTTDLALLANLGTPLLVFSGANVAVLSELRQFARDDGAVLIPDAGDGTYHFRDTDFFGSRQSLHRSGRRSRRFRRRGRDPGPDLRLPRCRDRHPSGKRRWFRVSPLSVVTR